MYTYLINTARTNIIVLIMLLSTVHHFTRGGNKKNSVGKTVYVYGSNSKLLDAMEGYLFTLLMMMMIIIMSIIKSNRSDLALTLVLQCDPSLARKEGIALCLAYTNYHL